MKDARVAHDIGSHARRRRLQRPARRCDSDAYLSVDGLSQQVPQRRLRTQLLGFQCDEVDTRELLLDDGHQMFLMAQEKNLSLQ